MIYRVINLLVKKYRQISSFFILRQLKSSGHSISLVLPLRIEGKSNVSIGNNTAIGTYVHIWGDGGVSIGSNVLIAAHCCITSLGHDYTLSLINKKNISKSVIIDDDVWLGYNVTVLPGVTIGKGSVIGAGSVVSKDIPPYSIAVGNPCKVIKKREIIENK